MTGTPPAQHLRDIERERERERESSWKRAFVPSRVVITCYMDVRLRRGQERQEVVTCACVNDGCLGLILMGVKGQGSSVHVADMRRPLVVNGVQTGHGRLRPN